MKKLITLLFIVIYSTVVFAQQEYKDVVYLKNGSIIRGLIVEQKLNEFLKIKIVDGSVFVYKMEEVDKIAKEKINDSQADGFFFGISYAVLLTKKPSSGDLHANHSSGSTSMKIGYVFQNNIGFLLGGDFHNRRSSTGGISRYTYIAKVGPVFGVGASTHIYPMIGYVGGEPAHNMGNGNGYYFGTGFDFKLTHNTGIYFEPGICSWEKEFSKDGMNGIENYELDESLYSFVMAIGVSLRF